MPADFEGTNNESPAVIQPGKPAAKSVVTLDIKPWGTSFPQARSDISFLSMLTRSCR